MKFKQLIVAVSATCVLNAAPMKLTIKGSDTMVHLVTSWADQYREKHQDADISVTGGGSGTGISAIINGTTNICASSRDVSEKEKGLAQKQGFQFFENVVARDGLAIAVHPSNSVKELTMDQLRRIYVGEVTNWKDVGGPDMPILLLSRESSSGTYVFFQEHVMKKKDYPAKTRFMPATSAIVQAVSSDRGSIGYVGLGYAESAKGKIKVLGVKADEKAKAVKPSEKSVNDGSYSVARPLYLYTRGEPTGAAKDFIHYAMSPEGQKMVTESGYVPLPNASKRGKKKR